MTDVDRSEELLDWYAEDDPDGAQLLNDLLATNKNYVAFPDDHAAAAVTLWKAATHALPAFEFAPRLVLTSPEKRCGKTRVLDIIVGTCHKPLATVNATVAAIFRSLGGDIRRRWSSTRPTPFSAARRSPRTTRISRTAQRRTSARQARAALRRSDCRSRRSSRRSRWPRSPGSARCPTRSPIARSTSRCADAPAARRCRSSDPAATARSSKICVTGWPPGQRQRIDELSAKAKPDMPVEDRAADTWEPLIAVADAAGGHWPETARAACKALVDAAESADEDRSLSTKLLADIRPVFTSQGVSFLSSARLVTELRRIEDSPWDDFELTTRKLAYRLRDFGVKPGRTDRNTVRGYSLESLTDAFTRYIRPHPSTSVTPQVNAQKREDGSKSEDGSIRPHENIRPQETAGQTLFEDGWTDADVSAPETSGFTPPTGPGRCPECGYHVRTQGHRDTCTANNQERQHTA